MRTTDTSYGESYWGTLDGGAGYQDSVMWEDLACQIKELFAFDTSSGVSVDKAGDWAGLDIGCAAGYLVRHMRRRGVPMFGVDFSRYILDKRPDDVGNLVDWADVTKPGALKEKAYIHLLEEFRFMTCIEVLEHIPAEAIPTVLGNIDEALAPGGMFMATICTDDRPGWDDDPTHINIQSKAAWREILDPWWKYDEAAVDFLRSHHLFRDHPGVVVYRKP